MRDFIELISIYLLTVTIAVLSLSVLAIAVDLVYPAALALLEFLTPIPELER